MYGVPGERLLLAGVEVQLLRSEVGVGRIVPVEAPHRRVAKQNAAAAVGLEPVLVRIDDNRVGLADRCVGPPRRLIQSLGNQPEVASVGRVHVNAEAVPLAQRHDFVQRIDRSHGRRAQRRHHRAHIALAQLGFESLQAHASAPVGRNGRIIQLQHGRDALVSVVCLPGADDAPGSWRALFRALRQLPGYPQRLQVGQRAAGG